MASPQPDNTAQHHPIVKKVTNGDYGADSTSAENTEQKVKPWVLESELAKLEPRPEELTTSPIPFFHFVERLKTAKRAGWERMGIKFGESISDHMYRMSIMTMMAPQSVTEKLNIPRCTKMALVHDMAEGLVGDITPADNIEKPEKSRREYETMDYVCTQLLGKFPGGSSAQDIRDAWQEYEDDVTPESKFVHDIDKMELLLQMVEYERKFKCEVNLGEFSWVAIKINMAEIRGWAKEVLLERIKLWQELGKTPSWVDDTPADKHKFLTWAKQHDLPIDY